MKKKKTVFVGLSGGVDSAVSAALLKKKGYEVVGVFIRTWHPDFLSCNEEQERHDAMRVAAYLDIPFLTFFFEKEYKKEVADYMIREYKTGRTPNPDVMCNKEIKFGSFLRKSISMGADFIATGHYAQIENSKLKKGKDPLKDQSYFLWALKPKLLPRIIFPIGNLKKKETRVLAKKFKLPVAEKKDSQGICFLGKVDLKEFLKHYIKEKKGKVLDEEGKTIGWHEGVLFYTLGERHGFTITKKSPAEKRYYITGKDVKKNTLTVSQKKLRSLEQKSLKKIAIKDVNWISGAPKEGKKYTAQIRYHGELLPCNMEKKKLNLFEVQLEKPVLSASGQSCVIYEKDICLGGGIIV